MTNTPHGQWSSSWMFILAATGSAVGLGNVWKFPYTAGEYGGGAFILIYLLCVFAIGIPVMMAEIMMGRRGRQSPINAMHTLALEAQQHHIWKLIGWSGVVAGCLILSFYSVIGGWAVAYVPKMLLGTFSGAQAEQTGAIFNALTANPWALLLWHTVFMLMTVTVIARGLEKGLERAVGVLMPALFLLLLVLVLYAMFGTGAFMQGVHFMFDVNFHALFYPDCRAEQTACKFSGQGVLSAMGLAFFSLSIGMGAIMMYGAYLPKNASITSSALTIAIADTLAALLAGLAIFPIVFAHHLDPGAGPGLVFVTLPIAFGQMGISGILFGTLFFLLLVFAAWTSAFSLLEPVVVWLVESWHISRAKAALGSGIFIWLLGILSVLSFNLWSTVKPLAFLTGTPFAEQTFFAFFDYLTSNILLPIGGLLIALFAAWVMSHAARREEMAAEPPDISYQTWLFLIRYITPVGVALVFLNAVGLFEPMLNGLMGIWKL